VAKEKKGRNGEEKRRGETEKRRKGDQ